MNATNELLENLKWEDDEPRDLCSTDIEILDTLCRKYGENFDNAVNEVLSKLGITEVPAELSRTIEVIQESR